MLTHFLIFIYQQSAVYLLATSVPARFYQDCFCGKWSNVTGKCTTSGRWFQTKRYLKILRRPRYVLRISVKIIQIRQFGVSYLFDLIHEIYFSVGFASIF